MLKFGYDISFFWVLCVTGLLALISGLRMLFLSKTLEQEAHSDWAYQVSENMQDLRLTEEAFVRAYKKINAPRGWKFLSMAFATVTVMSVPAFALIQLLLYKVWRDNLNEVSKMPQFQGRMAVLSDPVLVWQFSIFLAVIVFLVLVVALFVRQYYKGSPGLMRDELAYERAGFKPDTKLVVGPNPAHYEADDFDGTNSSVSAGEYRDDYNKLFCGALGLSKETVDNWNGTGHICDIYSDGSDMKIHVHTSANGKRLSKTTHPFFYLGKHARHDDKPRTHMIIVRSPNAFTALQMCKDTDISFPHSAGSETSRHCHIKNHEMDIYIYDERWS